MAKHIVLELDDDQYNTFESLNLKGEHTILFGRTPVRAKLITDVVQVEDKKDCDKDTKGTNDDNKSEEDKFDPADVNKDGKVDVKDAVEVVKKVVKTPFKKKK